MLMGVMPATRCVISVERRKEFVKAVEAGTESFADLCRQFKLSRQTGYRFWRRYQAHGEAGLSIRSRTAHHPGRAWPVVWRERLRQVRRTHPRWGPKKLRTLLSGRRRPSVATLGRWLRQMQLHVRRRRWRLGPRLSWPKLTVPAMANEVWTVDFKGSFCTRDGLRLHPLTVRDLFSRYVLCVRIQSHQREAPLRRLFKRLFRRYGQPRVIRCDHGVPWASTGPLGLSRLSVWWWRLGIRVEFTAKGHPEQNAAHEQHHRILKADTLSPPAAHPPAQQQRFQRWRHYYNHHRPHEALHQAVPARFYRPKPALQAMTMPPVQYAGAQAVRRAHPNGEIVWEGRRRFIGDALAGESLGLFQLAEGLWSVRFLHLEIGQLHRADPGGMRPAQHTHFPKV
jgi:transposase InsO family protein